jgi:hypothetical protein
MLRALFVAIVTLAGVGPVLAAADIDTCRDQAAEPEARLVACSAVTADDTITGKPRGAAYLVIGDSFMKKRDYGLRQGARRRPRQRRIPQFARHRP